MELIVLPSWNQQAVFRLVFPVFDLCLQDMGSQKILTIAGPTTFQTSRADGKDVRGAGKTASLNGATSTTRLAMRGRYDEVLPGPQTQ